MTITVVTRWKLSNVEEAMNVARAAKVLWQKHGAADLRVSQIYTGTDAGQWITAVVFEDWATYGKAALAIASEAGFQKLLAKLVETGAVTMEREILVGADL